MSEKVDTASYPPGITDLTYRCWELVWPNGTPVEGGDGIPHFRDEADAIQAIPDHRRAGQPDPQPREMEAPCWLAMAACGYLLDEDEWIGHHGSAEEAARMAADTGWTISGSSLICSADCDDCRDRVAEKAAGHA